MVSAVHPDTPPHAKRLALSGWYYEASVARAEQQERLTGRAMEHSERGALTLTLDGPSGRALAMEAVIGMEVTARDLSRMERAVSKSQVDGA